MGSYSDRMSWDNITKKLTFSSKMLQKDRIIINAFINCAENGFYM